MRNITKAYYLCLFVIINVNAFGYSTTERVSKIDSLEQHVSPKDKSLNQVDLLNQLSRAYLRRNADTAIIYAEKALELSKELKVDSAIGDSYYNLGILYFHSGSNHLALHFFHQSLEIRKRLDSKTDVLDCLNSIGVVYRSFGDYVNAISNYLEGLKISEELKDIKSIAYIKGNLGIVSDLQGNSEKALDYFTQSLDFFKQLNQKENIANTLTNIGNVYLNQKEYDEALAYYNESLVYRIELGDEMLIAISNGNIGVVYHDLNDFDKALEYFETSLKTYVNLGDKLQQARGLNNIGSTYLKMQKYADAEIYFSKSLIISNDIDAKEIIKTNYQNLGELYSARNDFEKALEYYHLFSELKDSLYNEENSRLITEMQAKYDLEANEKRILILERDNIKLEKEKVENEFSLSNQRTIIYVVSMFLVFSILMFLLFLKQVKLKRKMLTEKQDKLSEKLKSKERELMSTGKYISEKNGILIQTNEKLESLISGSNETLTKKGLKDLKEIIDRNVNNYEDWQNYKSQFDELFPDFTNRLTKEFPQISNNDIKLCIYLKSNISNKEIAQLLNISLDGIKSANKRLKKKMNISIDVSLAEFIRKY